MPPAACAECRTVLQPAAPSAPGAPAPQPVPWQVLQSHDGKTRLDFGRHSVIANPASGEAILLDHVKKEAIALPLDPKTPAVPAQGLPGLPAAPLVPPPAAQDLGKALVDGHEVEGKRFTIPSPHASLKPPGTVEMWTSTQFHLPVLTTVSGDFGRQVSRCKCAAANHPAALFQVPAGYKLLGK